MIRTVPVEAFPRILAEWRPIQLSAAGTVPVVQCPGTIAGISGTLPHVAGPSACLTRRRRLRNRPRPVAGTGFAPGRRRHARDRADPATERPPGAGSLSRHGWDATACAPGAKTGTGEFMMTTRARCPDIHGPTAFHRSAQVAGSGSVGAVRVPFGRALDEACRHSRPDGIRFRWHSPRIRRIISDIVSHSVT